VASHPLSSFDADAVFRCYAMPSYVMLRYAVLCYADTRPAAGRRFGLALKLAKDPRFVRMPCAHSKEDKNYGDKCLLSRAKQHRCALGSAGAGLGWAALRWAGGTAHRIAMLTSCRSCYIVATNDRELRRSLRQVAGVPIMCVWPGHLSLFLVCWGRSLPFDVPASSLVSPRVPLSSLLAAGTQHGIGSGQLF
jgi:rRNA-processing protein FCF1